MSALLLQSLGVVCSSCDQFNPPGSTRCSECGTSLGGKPAAAAGAPPVKPAAAPPSAAPSPVAPAQPPAGKAQVPLASAPPAATPGKPQPPLASAPPPATPGAVRAQPPLATQPPAPTPGAMKPPSITPAGEPLGGAGPAPRTDMFPPGMRPVAKPSPAGPRPQLTPSPLEPVVPATDLLKKPAAAPARPAPPAASRFGISILSGQNQGQRFRLGGAGCMVGRSKGAILFTEDVFVSPHHGTFILREGRLFIRDEGSLSGVFVSLSGGMETVAAGGFFAAGQRLFRFAGPLPAAPATPPGRPQTYGAPIPQSQTLFALEEVIVGGRAGRTVVTGGPLLTIGQQHCDLSYPGDETLAARHCELSPHNGGASLRDLSGGLGTFVRLPAGVERALNPGDRVRIGMQLLQVDVVA